MQELKNIHRKVKNHPFRLGDKKDWKSFYDLLVNLDKEFCNALEKKFEGKKYCGRGFFIHELRSAIWRFRYEHDEEKGRISGKGGYSKYPEEYEKHIPEYQSKIIIILESYISQIHHFVTSGEFTEFSTYYMGGDRCMKTIQSNGKSRWNKYKFSKEENKFEWVGKL